MIYDYSSFELANLVFYDVTQISVTFMLPIRCVVTAGVESIRKGIAQRPLCACGAGHRRRLPGLRSDPHAHAMGSIC